MATENDTEEQIDDQTTIIEGEAEPVLDADDAELQALEAQMESEAAGGEGEGEGQAAEPEPVQTEEGAAAIEGGETTSEETKPKPPMIPHPRFVEVERERNQYRDQTIYLQGQLAAAQTFAAQGGGQPAGETLVEQTPEQKIAAFRTQQQEIAKRFDDGELSMAEAEAQRQRIDDEIWNVRQGTLTPPDTQSRPQTAEQRHDLYLNEKYGELEAAHPYTTLIEGKHNWSFLSSQAMAELEAEGVGTIDPDNPAHDLLVRTRMAKLTDKYGPLMTGQTVSQPNGGQQQQQPGQQPSQISPTAKSRGAKLDMAETLPPDIGAAGNGGQGTDVWSEERVAALTEEEYEALPDATRSAIDRRFGDGASP